MIYDVKINNDIVCGIQSYNFFKKEELNKNINIIPWVKVVEYLQDKEDNIYNVDLVYKESSYHCGVKWVDGELTLKYKWKRGI